jgi:tetratricopeptide (TPR) repeat protein
MTVAIIDPKPSPIALEVQRIRSLTEKGQFAEALPAAEALRLQVPENRDVLYMIAICLRSLGRIPEALATLTRLEELHPKYSRLYQERGHCFVVTRSLQQAIAAFTRAVTMNPALPASWDALRLLLRMNQQAERADVAVEQLTRLQAMPTEIVAARSMFCDGELQAAEEITRQFLLKRGNQPDAMRLLANMAMANDVLDDAEFLLESVLLLIPKDREARFDYAQVLFRRHQYVRALGELDKLLKLDPTNIPYRTTYVSTLVGLGRFEQAVQLFRMLISETPRAEGLHLSIAHALKTMGRQEEAVQAYRTAIACRPGYGEAYWSIANLKTYRFTMQDIEDMRLAEAHQRTAYEDRYHLCFALGKALEDAGEYAESYSYYERGNALKHQSLRYRPETVERNTRLQIDVCTREFFAAREGVGCPSGEPIFIVGLPRSGSTLIEQILASHSQAEGTMELVDVQRLVQVLQGRESREAEPRYPALLGGLSAADFERFGEQYLADTRVFRTQKRHFIDKMPNNFRHLGLIHLMLPNAKIIDARREPLACCFSNFKQLFAVGQEFTYSFEDIARYYRTYVELMAHWDAVLPGKVLRVQHEDVVADLEGNVRRILAFCGLEFEAACLDFHKTERSVRTASSEQVRQPINRAGVDQWRNFEPWLGPLKEALGPLADL